MNNDKRSRSVQNIIIPDHVNIPDKDLSDYMDNNISKLENSKLYNTYLSSQQDLLQANNNSQPHLNSFTNVMSSQLSESRYSHQDTRYFPPKRKHFVERKPSITNFPLPKSYLQRYKESFFHDNYKNNIKEILSGLSIALTQIPEGVAISILAGVPPMTGLHATFIFTLVTTFLGGRPGLVSGASPAMAVVQKIIIKEYDKSFLYWCMIFCGIIQACIGIFQGTKLVRFISEPVLIGFLNALAVIIIKKQIVLFEEPCQYVYKCKVSYVSGSKLLYMILIASGVFISCVLGPLIPKIGHNIPWEIVALIISIIVNQYATNTKTIGDTSKDIEQSFPLFQFSYLQNYSFGYFVKILILSVQLAIVGLLETLMTAQILSASLKKKSVLKFTAISQGVSNFLCGWTRSLGGSGLLGTSKINVEQGGTKRLSILVIAIVIFFFLIFGAEVIKLTPMASLVGFMLLIGYKTFFWKSFIYILRMRKEEFCIVLLIIGIAIQIDLAVAVLIGIVFQAFLYVWWKAFDLFSKTEVELLEDGSSQKIYYFKGELFFSSVKSLLKRFRYKLDPDKVIIDATEMDVLDFSGCEALSKVQKNYHSLQKKLIIINLDRDSAMQIRKSKLLKKNTYFTA